MAKTPQIKAMYEKWCELERAKYKKYTQKEKDIPPLEQNKVFQPVRNMIICTVMQMKIPIDDIEIEMPEPIEFDLDVPLKIEEEIVNESVDNSVENSPQNKLYIKWSDSYKEAHKLIFNKESTLEDYKKAEQLLLSESNNVLAFYDLGKLYSTVKSGLKDNEKSFKFYVKALQGFMQIELSAKKTKSYLQYQIGMMFFKGLGTPINNQKAAEYFEKSVELGNQYAKRWLAFEYISGENIVQDIEKGIAMLTECADSGDAFACFKLGCLYLFGIERLEKNKEKAVEWLNKSAEQGNEYAQDLLDKMEQYQSGMLTNAVLGLFVGLSKCISDDYNKKFNSVKMSVDKKLRRMMHEKKQALGMKEDHTQNQGQSY